MYSIHKGSLLNVNKFLDVFNTQGITFNESDEVYNVLTKKALVTDVVATFLSMIIVMLNTVNLFEKTYSVVNQYGIQ